MTSALPTALLSLSMVFAYDKFLGGDPVLTREFRIKVVAYMKLFFSAIFLGFLSIPFFAQKPDEVLATAAGFTFTTNSLSENVRKAFLGQNAAVAAERARLFSVFVRDRLVDTEAKAQGVTGEAIFAAELTKIAAPSATEIKAVFDANRSAFGDRTIEQSSQQILTFLRNGSLQKALNDMVERLKVKHKYLAGRDVNARDLKPPDALFSIAGKPFTAADFEDRFKAHLYDVLAEIAAQAKLDLENTVFSTLAAQEARARNIEPGDLIATEITNKLRDFTDEERAALEAAFQKKLFEKYTVKFVILEPEPVAHNVSADDDPVFGKPSAPVTVIMFSDFQCSACAATHPVLKKVLASYGDKVKLVVRDFPLESVHENAFQAALAANAARSQGKVFEYIEILYQNQAALDAASLRNYAAGLGLNLKQFELDLSHEKTAAEIRKDIADGLDHGVRGTPTIFINGVKSVRLSADEFKSAIEKALARIAPK